MSYLYFPGRICSWQGRLTEETGSAGEEGNSTSRASQHLRHPQPTARAIHHHEQRGLLPHLRQRVNATEGSGVCQRRRPRPPRRRGHLVHGRHPLHSASPVPTALLHPGSPGTVVCVCSLRPAAIEATGPLRGVSHRHPRRLLPEGHPSQSHTHRGRL